MDIASTEFTLDSKADSKIPEKSRVGVGHWLLRDETPQLCLLPN